MANKSQTVESSLRREYILQRKRHSIKVHGLRIAILVLCLILWEVLTKKGIMNPFIFSSPGRILATLWELASQGALRTHILTSVVETLTGFLSGSAIGIIIAVLLWWNPTASGVLDPYLVVFNALPKTALGPIFIVCMGAGMGSIIAMTLAISLIVTILNVLNGFNRTDPEKVKLMRTLGASRLQIFTKLVLPANLSAIINVLKINIGLSWVGVITGEFLVSKAGLGYLIVYGSQVFKMDLVMTSVVILACCAMLMHLAIVVIERAVRKRFDIV